MKAGSPLKCVAQLAHCAGLVPSFELDPARCDAFYRLGFQHRCHMAAGSLVVHACLESLCSTIGGAVRGAFLLLGPILPRGRPGLGRSW